MQGSVRKRGNKWYYSFELACVDGKRKRIERSGGRTKKEALKSMRKAMDEYNRSGLLFDESQMSVSDYFDYWFDNYVKVNLKYNSQQGYRNLIDSHIKPALGTYHLKKLNAAALQEFMNKKYLSGLSNSMMSNLTGVLSKGLKMAVYPYQFIKENPMTYVTRPKRAESKTADDLKLITIEQYKQILERFPRGSTFYIPIQLAYHTGMRGAEICGLTWNNVDLGKKRIRVEQILVSMIRGHHELGTPKTKSSIREIGISDHLAQVLAQHKLDQKKNKLKYGRFYTDGDFVCTKEGGELVTTNTLKSWIPGKLYLGNGIDTKLVI